MIRLRCGNCSEILEVDDAFAGGVCRCKFCGTIQTVPTNAAELELAEGSTAQGSAGKAKPLYRREEQTDNTSGLDELADVVASSSGLSSGLNRAASRNKRPSRRGTSVSVQVPAAKATKSSDSRLRIAIAAAALLAIVVVVLVITLLGGEDERLADETTGLSGIDLSDSVSFVVDTGTASERTFRPSMLLLIDAARTLPAGGQYQFIFWPASRIGRDDADLSATALPARTLRPATAASLDTVRDRLDELDVGGSTLIAPAMDVALEASPGAILVVTGNAVFLPDDFAESVVSQRDAASATMPVHTITLGQAEPADELAELAELTGGQAIALSMADIRQLRREITARPEGGGS
ncbi:MAG: hypothetical protein AAGI46_02190 [Planctomycetota bacterium]